MLPNLRPSILHRHRKSPSLGNRENSEIEYQSNQDYWSLKRANKAQTEERLRKSLYGRPEEYQQAVQVVEQQRAKEKEALKQKEEEAEARWNHTERKNPEQPSAQIQRPWTIAALSIPEHVAERARRACQHEDNEANRRAAAENALVKRLHREAERRAVSKELSGEESFFNFGATSEKWIAPELRVKHIHNPAVHRSSVFPAGSATPSQQGTPRAASLSRASSISKPAVPAMQHPWAWDAEPMQSRSRR